MGEVLHGSLLQLLLEHCDFLNIDISQGSKISRFLFPGARSLSSHASLSTFASRTVRIGNESVPIQLAQCRFPGSAISSVKIQIHFSNKIHGSNFIEQHSETVTV